MSIFRIYGKKPKEKKKRKYKKPKGSEWNKNAQTREKWLEEQGFDNLNEYIDNVLKKMD